MCEAIDEIRAEQLVLALARARQQQASDKPKEKPLEAVAQ